MDDPSAVDDGPSNFEDSPLSPEHLGLLAGLVDVPVFAYLGLLLFEDVVFGALVGCLTGAGVALFLPYAIRRGADESDTLAEGGGANETDALAQGGGPTEPGPVGSGTSATTRTRGFHRAAAGFALGPAGIVAFAVRMVIPDALLAVLVAATVAVALYAVLSRVLPRE